MDQDGYPLDSRSPNMKYSDVLEEYPRSRIELVEANFSREEACQATWRDCDGRMGAVARAAVVAGRGLCAECCWSVGFVVAKLR